MYCATKSLGGPYEVAHTHTHIHNTRYLINRCSSDTLTHFRTKGHTISYIATRIWKKYSQILQFELRNFASYHIVTSLHPSSSPTTHDKQYVPTYTSLSDATLYISHIHSLTYNITPTLQTNANLTHLKLLNLIP